jgi:hypothetical protein
VLMAGAYFGGRATGDGIRQIRAQSKQTVMTADTSQTDTAVQAKGIEPERSRRPPAVFRGIPVLDSTIIFSTVRAGFAHGESGELPFWVGFVLIFAAAVAVAARFILRIGAIPRDSKVFKDALEEWIPLVECLTPTPRGIKKFINSVRYMAMFQRSYLPSPLIALSKQSTLLYRWTLRMAGIKREIRPEDLAVKNTLPDNALVGLSAVSFCAGRAFTDANAIDPEAFSARLKAPEFSRLRQDRINALISRIQEWNQNAFVERYLDLVRGRIEQEEKEDQ